MKEEAPWKPFVGDIRELVIGEGIRTIGANVFANSTGLKIVSFLKNPPPKSGGFYSEKHL